MGDISTCRLLIDSGEAAGSIAAGKISHELWASLGLPLPLPPTPGLLVRERREPLPSRDESQNETP